ncbi:unnamed protein product [Closterium sp. NIES-53]
MSPLPPCLPCHHVSPATMSPLPPCLPCHHVSPATMSPLPPCLPCATMSTLPPCLPCPHVSPATMSPLPPCLRCHHVSPATTMSSPAWQDIPALAAEAAAQHSNGVPFIVTAPIGVHPLVARVLEQRITHCLERVASGDATSACDACRDGGGCMEQILL